MLTLQSNKEIRINKGDSGMTPLFINVGDNLRPIGYEFNKPIKIRITPDYDYILRTDPLQTEGVVAIVDMQDPKLLHLINTETPDQIRMNVVFYEDTWRDFVLEPGNYHFIYEQGAWRLNGEEVDIADYGFEFPKDVIIIEPTEIFVEYELIDNDSTVYFQMWPMLQDPEVPLLEKVIYPKENLVITKVNDEILYRETINCVNSYGEILLWFNPEDTENFDRGKYLYQIRTLLYNKHTNKYDFKTMINRTPFYLIDDNFSQRMW